MRTFQTLDSAEFDAATGILQFKSSSGDPLPTLLALRREGDYAVISASFGPVEIALRPHYGDLARTLGRLKPVPGLRTTRQLGTGQVYLDVGLQPDGSLLLRPTLVGDASGHLCFNLALTPEACQRLYAWLDIRRAE